MTKQSKKKGESKFQPDQILGYIEQKGWDYSVDDSGENYKVQTCVFCGNSKGNFEIQKDRGYYKTWCCGEGGSFYELRKQQGDLKVQIGHVSGKKDPEHDESVKQLDMDALTEAANTFHQKIFFRPEAIQYLKSRGFTEDTIRHFKIGCQKQKGKMWITIPHWEKGKAVNLKYRSMPPDKKWRQEEGSKKVLFNFDALEKFDEVILTEGELKTVALHQMGFLNSCSLTGGVNTFKPEWVDQLERFKKIYILMDSDDPGQRAAEELSMRLGPERCYNIKLEDAKDADEWFFDRKHTAEEFQDILRRAKLFNVKNIVSLNDAMKMLLEEVNANDVDKFQGLMTPWEPVNKLTKGFRPGELIVLSAPPKIGKTTWAWQIALHQAALKNPVLFFCLEMSAQRLARKATQSLTNTRDEDLDADVVSDARYQLYRYPIYLPSFVTRGIEPEDVFESIKHAYRRYGLKLVVFDNLHFLVRSVDKLREQIGAVSQGFKLLAEELRIPIILIVHPRKLNKQRAMTADDFKESGSIHADADQIIMLHRKRKNVDTIDSDDPEDDGEEGPMIMEPQTDVIVDASRFTQGGKVTLYYEGHLSKFITLDEKKQE